MDTASFTLHCITAYVDYVESCVADACTFCTPADAANVREFLAAVDALREEGPPL